MTSLAAPRAVRDACAGGIAWREAGSGPAVVFLHGLGGSRTAWERQLAGLSDRRRCVAWDMPGYGASRAPDRPLDFALLADAVATLLDALACDRADVVGLSLGGMIAQHAALRHSRRIRSLVLVSSSPAFGLDGATDADGWRAARLAPLDAGRTPADIARDVLASVAGPALTGRRLEEAAAAMSRISPAALRAAVDVLPTHDLRDRLHEIAAPTLVVQGTRDRETPPAYGRFLAERIPGARLEEVDAGHLVPHEAPAAFDRCLRAFLDRAAR